MSAVVKAYSPAYNSVIRWRYVKYDFRNELGCSIITLMPRVASQPKNVGEAITVARTRTSSSL